MVSDSFLGEELNLFQLSLPSIELKKQDLAAIFEV